MISTKARASNGKNNAIATHALMINIPEVSPLLVTLVFVSWVKLSNEEYIVTSGQTNHLDFLIRSAIVVEVLAAKKSLHFFNHSWSVPARLTRSPVARDVFSHHQVIVSKVVIIA
jgi:hypothetical protein